MPCYTVQTVTATLKVADVGLLKKGLEYLYGQVEQSGNRLTWDRGRQSFDKDTGELRVLNADQASVIKQAYGAEIVKAQAKRYGWTLKKVGQFQYEVTKR